MTTKEKILKLVQSKRFTIIASFLGLYLLATGVSLVAFSYFRGTTAGELFLGDIASVRSKINPNLPRTEECPINGKLFTKIERDIWEDRRPIVAVVENHVDSRPQSGLPRADVIYEAVAEGGITRFVTIYYCGAAAEDVKIAPVRSARVHFIDWAAGYGDSPIFMHVGGANDYGGTGDTVKDARALELLETLGWRFPKGNDFDTTYDSGFPVFWRNYERLDHPVATEHTMMASLDAAHKEAAKRGLGAKYDGVAWDKTFSPWEFTDGKAVSNPEAKKISFEFWSNKSDYDVSWEYDQGSNRYLRSNGGKAHVDLETDEQLGAENVVIMFVKERGPVDRNLHIVYTTIGEGKAIIFQNGEVIEGTWEKDSRSSAVVFFDKSGKEVSFVRGVIWIEAVPAGNKVDF